MPHPPPPTTHTCHHATPLYVLQEINRRPDTAEVAELREHAKRVGLWRFEEEPRWAGVGGTQVQVQGRGQKGEEGEEGEGRGHQG